MARKKKPKRPTRRMVVGIRGTPEWKGWLDRFSRSDHRSIVDLITHSIYLYAKACKFEDPPER